jgi:hypothetical protein
MAGLPEILWTTPSTFCFHNLRFKVILLCLNRLYCVEILVARMTGPLILNEHKLDVLEKRGLCNAKFQCADWRGLWSLVQATKNKNGCQMRENRKKRPLFVEGVFWSNFGMLIGCTEKRMPKTAQKRQSMLLKKARMNWPAVVNCTLLLPKWPVFFWVQISLL